MGGIVTEQVGQEGTSDVGFPVQVGDEEAGCGDSSGGGCPGIIGVVRGRREPVSAGMVDSERSVPESCDLVDQVGGVGQYGSNFVIEGSLHQVMGEITPDVL